MYVKFVYDSGYCGGKFEEIVEFPNDMDEREIECEFEVWYENQKRDIPLEALWKLADFYGTSIDYLVGRSDEK